MRPPVLAIVLPCYNEEAIIASTITRLTALLNQYVQEQLVDPNSFLVFVDDGSRDKTLQILREHKSGQVRTLKLSANCGHQSALLAGMHYVTGKADCMISMDADLQDDITCAAEMLKAFNNGAQIVYGVRKSRGADTWFKKKTALAFYQLMLKLGVNLVYNHADFRLLSNQVLVEFGRYKEVNLFLRGIFPRMGFSNATVYYDRQDRTAGETKYPFRKMLNLAINGITSFSNIPLKIITWVGFLVFFGSLLASLWVVFVILTGRNAPGWASITLPIYFLGGVQLLALGIIGEYISRIYLETKQRPIYHLEEVIV
ncbi:MAG TPA: glycosyltransferase family 2 protein [Phnomibacter sp.]|nr:glycosyltransferase family 2 protein [Phnomibacter sp.]